MTYPQPPGDPNQPPDYPSQPPAYPPTYPAADPNQPAQPYGAGAPYPTYPPSQPFYPSPYAPPGAPAAPSQPLYPSAYPPGYGAPPSTPLYQQPQQPYPYGMQPGMPGAQPAAAGGMNFALLTQPQQRGFFIAGIAGLVLLLCFFALPFFGAVAQVNGLPLLGSSASQAIAPYGPIPAVTFAGSLAGWLWLVPLCALAAAGLSVWRAITTQAAPTGFTRRNMAILAAVLGGVALLLLVIVLFGLNSYASTALGVSSQSFSILGVSVGITASGSLGFGYWIMLIAALGVGIGGLLQLNTKS